MPLPVATSGAHVDLGLAANRTLVASPSLRVAPDASPARYFPLALVVADGAVLLGRRPVTVTPETQSQA